MNASRNCCQNSTEYIHTWSVCLVAPAWHRFELNSIYADCRCLPDDTKRERQANNKQANEKRNDISPKDPVNGNPRICLCNTTQSPLSVRVGDYWPYPCHQKPSATILSSLTLSLSFFSLSHSRFLLLSLLSPAFFLEACHLLGFFILISCKNFSLSLPTSLSARSISFLKSASRTFSSSIRRW